MSVKTHKHSIMSTVGVVIMIVLVVATLLALLFAPLVPTVSDDTVNDNRSYYFQLLDSRFANTYYSTKVVTTSSGEQTYTVEVDDNTHIIYRVYRQNDKEVFDLYYYGVYNNSDFSDPRDSINYEPLLILLQSVAKTNFTDTKLRALTITADPVGVDRNHFRRVAATKSSIFTYDAIKSKSGQYDITVHIYGQSISRNAKYQSVVKMLPKLKEYKQAEKQTIKAFGSTDD